MEKHHNCNFEAAAHNWEILTNEKYIRKALRTILLWNCSLKDKSKWKWPSKEKEQRLRVRKTQSKI